jgi:hypothetical protein
MFRSKEEKARDKEKNRFYLLPGQGGRAYHRKQLFILKAALLVGVLVSGLVALAVWLMNHPQHH